MQSITVLFGRQVLQLNLRTSVSLVQNKKQTASLGLWGTAAKSKIGVKEVLHSSPKKKKEEKKREYKHEKEREMKRDRESDISSYF